MQTTRNIQNLTYKCLILPQDKISIKEHTLCILNKLCLTPITLDISETDAGSLDDKLANRVKDVLAIYMRYWNIIARFHRGHILPIMMGKSSK